MWLSVVNKTVLINLTFKGKVLYPLLLQKDSVTKVLTDASVNKSLPDKQTPNKHSRMQLERKFNYRIVFTKTARLTDAKNRPTDQISKPVRDFFLFADSEGNFLAAR